MVRIADPSRPVLIRRLLRWALGIFMAWALSMVAMLVLGAVVPSWPRWLELPWSDFEDFAVTPDGRVLVYTSFYHRLLVYSEDGRFHASLPGSRGRGERRLAVDTEGRVYLAGPSHSICRAPIQELERGNLKCRFVHDEVVEGWRLGPGGELQPVAEVDPERELPAGIVKEGELLVALWPAPRRRTFVTDLIEVERVGDRLLVHRPDGSSVKIATPWYLYWAKYPFPAFVAWLGIFLFGMAEAKILKWL